MSNAVDLLDADVRAAAVAFLSEMGGVERDEAFLAAADLDTFDAAVTMARRILQAADAARAATPPRPRQAGPLNVADAQALHLDLGADAIAVLAWMPGEPTVDIALAATGNRTAAWRANAAQAAGLTNLIAAAFDRSSPAPTAPPSPAQAPETLS